jgi:hypothetical protein
LRENLTHGGSCWKFAGFFHWHFVDFHLGTGNAKESSEIRLTAVEKSLDSRACSPDKQKQQHN